MKPPAFTYHRPADLDEALAVLAEVGHDGKVLAGGQSLVPLLNMRLAAPRHLVDINRIGSLAYLRRTTSGPAGGADPGGGALATSTTGGPGGADGGRGEAVEVGALARHAEVERDPLARTVLPLLAQATRCVAHAAVRNRGTTVGSLVHADPAAEMPAVLALLAGSVRLASVAGARDVPAADFFLGPLESAVRPGELAVSARFPVPAGRTGSAWLEVSRRHGDYALAGAGVLVSLDDELRVRRASAGLVSVGPTPLLVDLSEAVAGWPFDAADWRAAGALAAAAVQPEDDIHATAGYRRHLVGVLVARAGARAAATAGRLAA